MRSTIESSLRTTGRASRKTTSSSSSPCSLPARSAAAGGGLYLCRANLDAGGHGIEYTTDERRKRLPGANFVFDFKGTHYD